LGLQDSVKQRIVQRRRRFHRTPLNLPEVDFQMPDISIEKFSTFFGNTLEDAKHMFNFKSICHDYNLTEDNVTCRLFLQTLCGDVLQWYGLLLPNTIISWDVLENSFAENFIPRAHSYVFVDAFNVVSHPPSPKWMQENEMTNFEEESNQILDGFYESSHIAGNEDEKSNLKEENFILLYTPYEDISRNKFENEIKEPPPNGKEYFILATDDEKSQEHL
jgi:hypothetical protein